MMTDKTVKKVKTKWIVTIPAGAKVMVKEGEDIDADKVLLEVRESSEAVADFSKELLTLGQKDKDKFLVETVGNSYKLGDVFYVKKGIFVKKYFSPLSGKLTKLDEFNNLHFEAVESSTKTVRSPVNAKVVKCDGERLELEFRAEEFPGTGVTEGKTWGLNGLSEAEKITDLNFSLDGKVVIIADINQALVRKAEVVGVKGLVVLSEDSDVKSDRIESKLPILALDKELFEKLRKEIGDKRRVLLNANSGRLLLAI